MLSLLIWTLRMRAMLVCCLVLAPSAARAATIIYTDRETFTAAIGSSLTLTFDERPQCIPTPGLGGMFCDADYGALGITYDTAGGVQPASLSPSFILVRQFTVQLFLDAPTTAVGFDVAAAPLITSAPFNFWIDWFSGGQWQSLLTTVPLGTSFFGIQSDTPFTQMMLASHGSLQLDTMQIQTTTVPEVSSSWLLLLIGLGGLTLQRAMCRERMI